MPKLKKKSIAQKLREKATAKRLARQNSVFRQEEQEADTKSHRLARQDSSFRTHEKKKNAESQRLARRNPSYRTHEAKRDTESRRLKREDPTLRSIERRTFWEAERKRRNSSKSSYEKLLEKYTDQIRQSPSYICSCCGGLWYEKSTTTTSQETLIQCGCSQDFIDTVLRVNQDQHRFCATCKKSISQKRVPRLCLSNGFDFPTIPDDVKVKLAVHVNINFIKIK
jgi:rubrerythrin